MSKRFNHDKYIFWALLGLSVILLFPGLGKASLWIYDEARNAECAREMYERNDWIVPTFNGELRTLKPPLHYFFMFGGFKLFGINEWGARFFSAVCGVTTVLVTYLFIKRFSSRLHAVITCLVLLASTHFLFQFRMSVPDPYLIMLNTLAIFAAFAYFLEKKFGWLLLSAIALGLGTLAKGPVSIALPGASVFLWLLWERKLKEVFSWKIFLAGLIAIGIALPWYIAVHYATNGEWTRGFFLENNIGRFSAAMEGHGGPFIVVPLFVLVGLLPFSVFVGEALRNFKARFGLLRLSRDVAAIEKKEGGSKTLMRLALCVTVIFLVFYSISQTKLPNYPMPCYPFVAAILGYYVSGALKEPAKVRMYPFIVLLIINLAIPIAIYYALKNEPELNGLENMSFFMILLALAASTGIYLVRKNFRHAVATMFGIYTVFNILFFVWFYPTVYLNNPMSKTIDTVRKYKNVIAYDLFQPSFTFYLPERVKVFTDVDSIKSYLKNNNAVILVREENAVDLEKLGLKKIASHHDLFENSTTVILTNKVLQNGETRLTY